MSIEKYLPIFDSIGKLVGIEKRILYLSENQVWYVTMRMASLCLGGIINTDLNSSKLGSNVNLPPSAVGLHWTPIFRNFGQYLLIPPRQSEAIVPLKINFFLILNINNFYSDL